jgi:uncharacterized membrane protein
MESRLIIMESPSNLRARGRAALAGHWKEAVLAVLIYNVLLSLVSSLIDAFLGWQYTYTDVFGETVTSGASPSGIYMLLVGGPLTFGITMFFLNLFRHQDTDITQVVRGFEKFGKSFVLMLLIGIFTILWLLLLVVPGIIALLRYSQAFYIMNDRPELSAMDCIRESKRMMDGNKAKLFVTALTFIGWAILAALPAAGYSAVFMDSSLAFTPASALPSIGYFILSAGSLWVTAYLYATFTAFYELLRGNLSGQVFAPDQY